MLPFDENWETDHLCTGGLGNKQFMYWRTGKQTIYLLEDWETDSIHTG